MHTTRWAFLTENSVPPKWKHMSVRVLLTENGVPPSGNTVAVVGQSVAGRAPGVVRSKWRE